MGSILRKLLQTRELSDTDTPLQWQVIWQANISRILPPTMINDNLWKDLARPWILRTRSEMILPALTEKQESYMICYTLMDVVFLTAVGYKALCHFPRIIWRNRNKVIFFILFSYFGGFVDLHIILPYFTQGVTICCIDVIMTFSQWKPVYFRSRMLIASYRSFENVLLTSWRDISVRQGGHDQIPARI